MGSVFAPVKRAVAFCLFIFSALVLAVDSFGQFGKLNGNPLTFGLCILIGGLSGLYALTGSLDDPPGWGGD